MDPHVAHVRASSSKGACRERFLTVFIKVVQIGRRHLSREKGDDPKVDRECSPIGNFIRIVGAISTQMHKPLSADNTGH